MELYDTLKTLTLLFAFACCATAASAGVVDYALPIVGTDNTKVTLFQWAKFF